MLMELSDGCSFPESGAIEWEMFPACLAGESPTPVIDLESVSPNTCGKDGFVGSVGVVRARRNGSGLFDRIRDGSAVRRRELFESGARVGGIRKLWIGAERRAQRLARQIELAGG